ncbi:hypothetical protein A3F08_00960 [Candidatus Berkelbacteria bacterium RIFCSPHIGHO2_12_FULL_36_9]|uniref:Uncharacterized protein n=1 Tax=Candidatus Berkelbacteria bacterium RIFCSPHIGHO2_12_FULL_36_9 TaxID=1797469 RepID=A0A1F5EIC4_9BACT|nr:MAG: hypothetical protein A3F08_00960 [Candidatus Berkelbacteria bacterium RIFCSPHIGHO2_12_FULL_36_9]
MIEEKNVPKEAEIYKSSSFSDIIPEEVHNQLTVPNQQKAQELSPNEIERQCEKIAELYIQDLEKVRSVPVRFCFSGLLDKILKQGFSGNSFIVDDTQDLLSVDMSTTKNENSSHMIQIKIREATEEGFSDLHPKQIEILRTKYPEIFQKIKDNIILNTGEDISDMSDLDLVSNLRPELRDVLNKLNLRLISPPSSLKSEVPINIDGYEAVLSKYCTPEQEPLVRDVIINLISSRPLEKWNFEAQELFIDSMAKYFNETYRGFAEQIYDLKLFIDPTQITSMKKGFLPGIEFGITAPSKSIIGVIIQGEILSPDYYIEKLKRLFTRYPHLSRPMYDYHGNLLWPQKMSHKGIEQYLSSRGTQEEAQKN